MPHAFLNDGGHCSNYGRKGKNPVKELIVSVGIKINFATCHIIVFITTIFVIL